MSEHEFERRLAEMPPLESFIYIREAHASAQAVVDDDPPGVGARLAVLSPLLLVAVATISLAVMSAVNDQTDFSWAYASVAIATVVLLTGFAMTTRQRARSVQDRAIDAHNQLRRLIPAIVIRRDEKLAQRHAELLSATSEIAGRPFLRRGSMVGSEDG